MPNFFFFLMDIREALLVNSLRELLKSQLFSVTKINASHIYPGGRDQNEYELLHIGGISKKLWYIRRSRKIKFTFNTESAFRKILCKPKGRIATGNKIDVVFEINCNNCETVYFCESKLSLKLRSDELNITVRNCDCEENKIAKHCQE